MKKILSLFAVLTSLFITIPSATASTPVVRIVDVPHRNFDGTFRDDKLVGEMLAGGRLGKLLLSAQQTTTWVIDAYLIDEVQDMADGYTFDGKENLAGSNIAKIWLQQLKIATRGNPIIALPYGNPDPELARELAPSEINYYSKISSDKLENFFGRPVISQNGWENRRSRLEPEYQSFYRNERTILLGLSKVISASEIEDLRMKLGVLLNPGLGADDQSYLSYSAKKATEVVAGKLKVVSGHYRLTSENVKVPLTLVNKFDTSTTLSLSLIPMNSRVQVENLSNITLPPHSQIQMSVPFKVIASGSTLVLAQYMTPQGVGVGEVFKLNLSLTVIDSRVAWFTTAAGVVLFLGAVTQSVRRIRRSRREK